MTTRIRVGVAVGVRITVNSLLTDSSLRRTLRLVPAIYTLVYHNQTLFKTDTSIRRTTDTSQVEKRSKYLSEWTDNGLINRFR